MTDERRAEELKNYLLSTLVGESRLSNKSIGYVLLGLSLESSNTLNRARNVTSALKSVGGLVKAIENIQKAIRESPTSLFLAGKGNKRAKINTSQPTQAAVLRAFLMLSRLTWEERNAIGLAANDHDLLVKAALLNLDHYQDQQGQQRVLDLYKASISISSSSDSPDLFTNLQEVNQYIESLYSDEGSFYLCSLARNLEGKDLSTLQNKVKNAVKRLLLQAGSGQIRFISVNDNDNYVRNYLTPSFVKRFTQTVSENNLLNKEFPIFLKSITLRHPGPLPLPRQQEGQVQGLFHKGLLELCYLIKRNLYTEIDEIFEQLIAQPTSEVIGEFCIRVKETDHTEKSYQPFSPTVYEKLKTQIDEHIRVHFNVSSTGLGGTLSHIIRVINRSLLWDIECLKREYFPIAHDILVDQELIGNNIPSPVWSHSLVKLCRNKTIQVALWESCKHLERPESDMKTASHREVISSYEEYAFIDPDARGDYCSFDTLDSAAKAALQARLMAIKIAGIPAKEYRDHLLLRAEQRYILQEGKSLANGYPFSALAMENYLQVELIERIEAKLEEVIKDQNNKDKEEAAKNQNSKDEEKSKKQEVLIPYVLLDAYLTLAETFIEEGAYRKAYEYLIKLQRYKIGEFSKKWSDWCRDYAKRSLHNETLEDYAFSFSGSLLARYELCLAEYFYILDWKRESKTNDKTYFLGDEASSNAEGILKQAWSALDRAEQILTLRLTKYHIINEISQATLYPYYNLLSRIYLLRARMLLLYPNRAGLFEESVYRPPTDHPFKNRRSSHQINGSRLFLLERARVYAACDGNSELYVIHTAYQCWALLIASFMDEEAIKLEVGDQRIDISRDDCLARANLLRCHALLEYAEIGLKHYHAIKEKSGLSGDLADHHQEFGHYKVDPIPAIRETIGENPPGYKPFREEAADPDVLRLDMRFLALRRGLVDPDKPKSTESIYLFGPKACYLFFIRGLYHLCSDDENEFSRQDKTSLVSESLEWWDRKLKHCYQLFTYAWAIADDGCKIDTEEENHWKLLRYANNRRKTIPDPHAASVIDLYPYRVTEIADLGKVFAAASIALRLYTLNSGNERDEIYKIVNWLLEDLYKEKNFRTNPSLKKALRGQERFNGYLETYLAGFKTKIEHLVNQPQHPISQLKEVRYQLIKEIFELT